MVPLHLGAHEQGSIIRIGGGVRHVATHLGHVQPVCEWYTCTRLNSMLTCVGLAFAHNDAVTSK